MSEGIIKELSALDNRHKKSGQTSEAISEKLDKLPTKEQWNIFFTKRDLLLDKLAEILQMQSSALKALQEAIR